MICFSLAKEPAGRFKIAPHRSAVPPAAGSV